MAKEKKTTFRALPPAEQLAAPKPTAAPPAEEKVVYSWPSRSRCPRCGSLNTRRTGDYDSTQYRECDSPTCRHRYSVTGTKV